MIRVAGNSMVTARRALHPSARTLAVVAAALFLASPVQKAVAETKGFAFSWFYPAMYTQADNCPDGVNPTAHEIFRNALITTGTKPEDAERIIESAVKGEAGSAGFKPITERGVVDGKRVNAYTNPLSVPDPGFKTAIGKYALGFNLDGKAEAAAASFEDPETQEKGVDNQLFRLYGCQANYQALAPARPGHPQETWEQVSDDMPAWLLTVTGDDLSKDGAVTITLDRALTRMSRDANGHARSGATFRTDPNARSHNVLKGEIKNGVITAAAPKAYLLGDQFFLPDFDFTQVRLRFTVKDDGHAQGILGGYLPWLPLYYQHGQNGLNAETFRGMDMVGLFRALKRLADADPDPKTGQNRRISTAYWMELVPAFVLSSGTSNTSSLASPKEGTRTALAP